jgi:thiol-disulfide isomerase/thioredoxin
MNKFDNVNIAYLEINDVKPTGVLKKYVTKGKKTVVMAQGLNCGHCTDAKPAFKEFALKTDGLLTCATICIDGSESEHKLGQKISEWDKNYRGVPTYLIFDTNGNYIETFNDGRDVTSLMTIL